MLYGAFFIILFLLGTLLARYLLVFTSFLDIYTLVLTIAVFAIFAVCAKYGRGQIAVFVALLPLFPYYYRSWGQKWVHTADFLLLMLTLSLLIRYRRHTVIRTVSPITYLILLLLVTWMLLGLFGVDAVSSFRGVFSLSPMLAITILLFASMREDRIENQLIGGITSALTICCIFAIMQLIFGPEFSYYSSLNPNIGVGGPNNALRYPGPMNDPQAFGQFICVLTLFCLGQEIRSHSISRFLLSLAGITFLLLTGSRSPLLGLLAGVSVILFLNRTRSKTAALSLILLIGGIALIFIPPGILLERFSRSTADAVTRIGIWERSMPLFTSSPIVGVGWDNYSKVIPRYDNDAYWVTAAGDQVFDQPESTFVKICVETGIIGSIVFLLLMVACLREYFKCIRSLNHYNTLTQTLLTSSLAALIGLMVCFTTVYTLDDHRILFIYAILITLPFCYAPPHDRINCIAPHTHNGLNAMVYSGEHSSTSRLQ